MMSRSRTLPSFSSSRQMMMAWKVSGLSQSPAIIASRPASMRLAMAISPSRDSSSTEPISRRYMRTGSSVRSVGSDLRGRNRRRARGFDEIADFGLFLLVGGGFFAPRLPLVFALDDVDAHLVEHRIDVFDLVGGDLLRRQDGVQFVMGDIAALLGGLIIRLTAASERSSNGLSAVSTGPRLRPRASLRLSSPYSTPSRACAGGAGHTARPHPG